MKEVIVSLLQQRMDKCTSEQFWAVATLTGLNTFVISQKKYISEALPRWIIPLIITIATVYGAYYIIHRHTIYYFYRAEQARLLQNEEDVPNFLKSCPDKWKFPSLSGVLFYVSWILLLWLVSLITYL